ncbi:MAG: hypothetical protein FJ308_15185 [Planctomycetes bacterium]|nr:hypothetical protein [Planctomycetota bacterium]
MQLGQGAATGHKIELGWYGPTHGCWDWLLQHFKHVTHLTDDGLRDWLERSSDISSATNPKSVASMDSVAARNTPKSSPTKESAPTKGTSSKNLRAKNNLSRDNSDTVATNAPVSTSVGTSVTTSNSTVLLAAFEHRSDPRLCVWQSSLASFPNSSKRNATVLGSDWQGHRRTCPLPDSVESFYWFQLCDRIVPWALYSREPHKQIPLQTESTRQSKRGLALTLVSGRNSISTTASSGTQPRVQRLLDINHWYPDALMQIANQNPLAWIVSDDREQRMAWQDTLGSYGVRAVASRPDDASFWATPNLIVVDCVSRDAHPSGTIPDCLKDFVVDARGIYPDAFLVLVDPFPAWRRWEWSLDLGVDALVPRPFDLAGILATWQLWVRGGANRAILR